MGLNPDIILKGTMGILIAIGLSHPACKPDMIRTID